MSMDVKVGDVNRALLNQHTSSRSRLTTGKYQHRVRNARLQHAPKDINSGISTLKISGSRSGFVPTLRRNRKDSGFRD